MINYGSSSTLPNRVFTFSRGLATLKEALLVCRSVYWSVGYDQVEKCKNERTRCLCVLSMGMGDVDGGWMPLPTCPWRYCNSASLVSFFFNAILHDLSTLLRCLRDAALPASPQSVCLLRNSTFFQLVLFLDEKKNCSWKLPTSEHKRTYSVMQQCKEISISVNFESS